ncbi:MAG: hypothetical protein Q9162_006290 [Coniocarpon cinnabarinum]
MEEHYPNFNNFEKRVLGSHLLNNIERDECGRFLRLIRKSSEKAISVSDRHFTKKSVRAANHSTDGIKTNYLTPRFHRAYYYAQNWNSATLEPSTITWVCLPYFALGAYEEQEQLHDPSQHHPELTLHQYFYGDAPRKQDMEQAASILLKQEKYEIKAEDDSSVRDKFSALIDDLQSLFPNLTLRTSLQKRMEKCKARDAKSAVEEIREVVARRIKSLAKMLKKEFDLVAFAHAVCHYFVDPSLDAMVVQKFWGAVQHKTDQIEVNGATAYLVPGEILVPLMESYWILGSSKEDLKRVEVPHDFLRLWLACFDLVIGLCYDDPALQLKTRLIEFAVSKSMNGLACAFSRPSSVEKMETVSPEGVVPLLCNRLVTDLTQCGQWLGSEEPDIGRIYNSSYKALYIKVNEQAHDRGHQQTVHNLTREVDIIKKILEHQREIVQNFQNAVEDYDRDASLRDNSMRSLKVAASLGATIDVIERRFQDFQVLKRNLEDLVQLNLIRIDTNKDRQEAAILIFTVFTVIFLPSSFVAQFLAIVPLNFQDIGSMQWLFWAIAMPLTLIVLTIVLAWAGELENVVSSVLKFFFKGRGLIKEKARVFRPDSDERDFSPVEPSSYVRPRKSQRTRLPPEIPSDSPPDHGRVNDPASFVL